MLKTKLIKLNKSFLLLLIIIEIDKFGNNYNNRNKIIKILASMSSNWNKYDLQLD